LRAPAPQTPCGYRPPPARARAHARCRGRGARSYGTGRLRRAPAPEDTDTEHFLPEHAFRCSFATRRLETMTVAIQNHAEALLAPGGRRGRGAQREGLERTVPSSHAASALPEGITAMLVARGSGPATRSAERKPSAERSTKLSFVRGSSWHTKRKLLARVPYPTLTRCTGRVQLVREGGTRRVQLVREGGGRRRHLSRSCQTRCRSQPCRQPRAAFPVSS